MSKPPGSALRNGIQKQLDATWNQWRKAIEQVPAEHWRTGDIDYLIPARHALHVVNTVHAYCRHEQPESWNGLTADFFGRHLDWEGTPPDDLPDQTSCLAYLEHVCELTQTWLDAQSDEDLLAPQNAFTWTGPNLLSRMIYVIRHSQDHSGQLNAELRRRDLPRAAWEA